MLSVVADHVFEDAYDAVLLMAGALQAIERFLIDPCESAQ
jgi:hypothetical protein